MCLQCDARAVSVVENVLPGYTLMISTVDSERWPVGWYGLVRSNDPDVVFPGDGLVGEPQPISDEELEAMSPDDPRLEGWGKHAAYVEKIETHFKIQTDILVGYWLTKACMDAGYNQDEHGFRIISWLVNHLDGLLHPHQPS